MSLASSPSSGRLYGLPRSAGSGAQPGSRSTAIACRPGRSHPCDLARSGPCRIRSWLRRSGLSLRPLPSTASGTGRPYGARMRADGGEGRQQAFVVRCQRSFLHDRR